MNNTEKLLALVDLCEKLLTSTATLSNPGHLRVDSKDVHQMENFLKKNCGVVHPENAYSIQGFGCNEPLSKGTEMAQSNDLVHARSIAQALAAKFTEPPQIFGVVRMGDEEDMGMYVCEGVKQVRFLEDLAKGKKLL